jgi:hypothetical protein
VRVTPPEVLATVRLRIANQGRIVNQIAGTYKEVYRALMEYVDNSADAAAVDPSKPRHLMVTVDAAEREVVFEDDCSGMSPEKLGDLLQSIGKSTKANLPWVNGEFGFGVHAFRAFAQHAEFVTRAKGSRTCVMTIDREADENQEVPITEALTESIRAATGTRVRVYGFRKGVFKGSYFASNLRKEIEEHFDDVIQNGILEVRVRDTRGGSFEACKPADLASFPGMPIKKTISCLVDGVTKSIEVDAKLVEGPPIRHPIILTRNGRRILPVGEIRSFRNHLRLNGRLPDVWTHPQLSGRIEIRDIASPNITRDDFQPGEGREALFDLLLGLQSELESVVQTSETKHRDRQLDSAAKILSERLAHVMKRFSATFRRPVSIPGSGSGGTAGGLGLAPGGSESGGGGPGDVPGAGGPEPTGGGGQGPGSGGLGSGDRGAHEKGGPEGKAGGTVVASGGPELRFSHLDPQTRCQLVGYQITVNVDHSAYKQRSDRGGLDERLLNHVARVISPPLTQKLYESLGQVPLPLEFGEKVVDLSILLEDDFMEAEEDIAIAMRLADTEETNRDD